MVITELYCDRCLGCVAHTQAQRNIDAINFDRDSHNIKQHLDSEVDFTVFFSPILMDIDS
jgi:hypothetical protein